MRYAWLCGLLLSAIGCYGSSADDDDDNASAGSGGSTSAGTSSTGGSTSSKGGSTSSTGGSTSARGGSTSSGGGVPLEDLPVTFAQVNCAKTFECCSADEIAANPDLGTNVNECTASSAALLGIIVPFIQDAVTGGRVQYDGVAFQTCVSVVASLTCAQARDGTSLPVAGENCGLFLIPLVELGGACEQSFECIDAWCDTSAGSLCSPLLADGSDCFSNSACQSGYCDLVCGPEPVASADGFCAPP